MQLAVIIPIIFGIVAAGSDATISKPPNQNPSTHTVLVGSGGLPFQPSQTSLPIGDILRFVFAQDKGIIIQSSLQEPCEPNGGFQAPGSEGQVDILVSGTEPQWFLYSDAPQGCSPDALFGLNVPRATGNHNSKGSSNTSLGVFPTLDAHGMGVSFVSSPIVGTTARWTGSVDTELETCASTFVTVTQTQTVTVFTVIETVSVIEISDSSPVPSEAQSTSSSSNALGSSFSYEPTKPALQSTNPGTVGSQASLGLAQATNGSWSWPTPSTPSKQLLPTTTTAKNKALVLLPSSSWLVRSALIILLVQYG